MRIRLERLDRLVAHALGLELTHRLLELADALLRRLQHPRGDAPAPEHADGTVRRVRANVQRACQWQEEDRH